MAKKLATKIISLSVLLIVFTITATAIMLNQLKTEEKRHVVAGSSQIDATILDKPRVIDNFTLTASDGTAFSQTNLRGHWTLMFFGFTNCGYVCPTTLAALNKMYSELQGQLPAALMPQVVMVSVDPDRDSVQRMREYVQGFNKAFIGLRGSVVQTQLLAKQMSVVFTKIVMADGNYMMNHSAEIMLVDPNGKLRGFLPFPHKAPQMVQDYEALVKLLPKA